MKAELKPCPFCGGKAERIDFGPGDGENEGGSCIACTQCESSGPVEFGYKENFVSNWNTRAQPPAVGLDVTDAMATAAAREWCALTDTSFDRLTSYQQHRAMEDFRIVLKAALRTGGGA
ncbi:Lar family restriction alleviation protein [Luteimonas sp BLCC-B24]|uniref:Lar family restriction alleviation protein n=1 Tax=Luteimonas sp. BLCC-B24 TaxID=3025317 RepID=UPI00234E101B|nr:Lar family restriction alleviation protein [Luteimonas sp. BLCC-B24]MDC7806388.1 Lar family restriction alleviation protein [Luteimonas sp. BLCC-B24]